MDVDSFQRDDKEISFYNPLTKPITVDARNEQNEVITYDLQPLKMYTYPAYIANHLIKNITDAYMNENNINPLTEPQEVEEFKKKVYGS